MFFRCCCSRTLCHFFVLRMKSYIKSIMKIDKWLFAQSRECQHCPCGIHTHQIIIIRVQGSIFVFRRQWNEWNSKGTPKNMVFWMCSQHLKFQKTHPHPHTYPILNTNAMCWTWTTIRNTKVCATWTFIAEKRSAHCEELQLSIFKSSLFQLFYVDNV